jgi:DNA-binding MarR family transcriptional regulator
MAFHSPFPPGQDRLAHRARAILAERQRRSRCFDANLFGEPAWDILLALYGGAESSGRQTIGQLIRWIQVPQTTALRWIAYLEDKGLVFRRPHPTDMRIAFIELSEKARTRLADYLAGVDIES